MITTAGRAYLADQMGPRTLAPLAVGNATGIAIGTGTPSASGLGAEVSRRPLRNVVTSSGGTVSVQTHWDVQDQISGTYTEAMLYAGSTVIAYKAISQAKGVNDPFVVTWNFIFP